MTLFDWILILIVAGGAFYGWHRGIIAQIGSLIGIIAAIIICQVFAGSIAESFNSPGDTAQTRLFHTVLTYVLIFMACYIGARMLSRVFSGTISALNLGGIDNIAGAVFKVLEWVLIYSIFLNLWIMVMPRTDIRSSRSSLTRTVLNFAPQVLGSKTASEVFSSVDKLSDKTRDTVRPDTTEQQKPRDAVRDAAVERVLDAAVEHRSDPRR